MKGNAWINALKSAKVGVASATDALPVIGWLDSGNYALNWAISGQLLRGWPLGRTAELSGDPGTGKSFLVARAVAMAQQQDPVGVGLLEDAEGAWDMDNTRRLGVDTDALAVAHSTTVQQHLAVAKAFCETYERTKQKGPGVIVLDSIALLSTDHEQKVELDKPDMSKAKELRTFYRLMLHRIAKHPIIHLATNHTIANIGNMFQPRTTGGGGGPKFAASIRLDLRAVSKIPAKGSDDKNSKEYIGVICTVFVEKNRITAPWKRVQLAIPFNQPISRASGLIALLTDLGVLQVKGNFLFHGSAKIGRAYSSKNREHFLRQDEMGEALLDEYPELLEEADTMIREGRIKSRVTEGHEEAADDAGNEEADD